MNAQTAARVGDDLTRDLILDDDYDEPDSRSRYSMDNVMQSVQNFSTLSEGLRILGAAVLIASMSVFLLQGWNEGNDISRYLLLLSQTGLLAVGGFALSYGLKETKGARLFFGLALVSIPANFTILSALLYSVFQWDGALGTYPEYATWQIGDIASTSLTLGGAMLVLTPITMFCFAIMARRSAIALSLHFLLLNTLLLLPIRSSALVGVVALFGTLYGLCVAGKLSRNDGALSTPEGKFALATLFIPTGIILFRSIYFYQVDSLMVSMLLIAVFVTLRQVSLLPGRNPRVATWLETLSLPVAFFTAISITNSVEHLIAWEFQAPVFATAFAAMALDLVRRTDSRLLSRLSSACISLAVGLSLVFNVCISTTPMTALMCLVAGSVLAIFGHGLKDPVAFFTGYLTIGAGVVFGFNELFALIVQSSWIDLAVFGASAIALGSVLDRHGASIKLRVNKWFAGLR